MTARILVVDDNTFERDLLVKALTDTGHDWEVVVAVDSESTFRSVDEARPDVVLLDQNLPGLSGLEILSALRERGHDFPIIICTAEYAGKNVLDALRAGARDFVVKDTNYREFVPVAVQRALSEDRQAAERHSLRESLQVSTDCYERLVVNAPEIMFQVSSDGRFLYVNEAVRKQLGLAPQKFYEDSSLPCKLLHPEDRDHVRRLWEDLLQNGGEVTLETRITAGELRTLWLQIVAYSVPQARDKSGHVVQGVARNVTESRELQRQRARERVQLEEANRKLLELNRMKNEFIAGVSHELRTPMNSIIGYTDCLLDGLDGPLEEEQIKSLQRVRKNAGHLLGLINDILDLAKIEAGKMQLFPEEFDLTECINDALAVARPLRRDESLELLAELPDSLPVSADLDKVRRIILNLLSNAIKFTREGHVKIRAYRSPSVADAIKLEVEDTGIGIKEEDLPLLFEDFQQVDGSASKEFSGTGLGLSISKRLVEAHDGQIWVKSEAGVGSTFHVLLPVLRKQDGPGAARPLVALEELSGEQRIILVADRQVDTTTMIKKVLVPEGYQVVGTWDAEEAFRLAQELRPIVVLADSSLCRSTGQSLVEALRKNDVTRNLPVMLITLEDSPDLTLTLGAVGWLTKPLELKTLLEKVQEIERGRGGPSILLVDDEPHVLALYQDMLQTAGYHDVRTAGNGLEALEQIQEREPHLVFMDLVMPEMDGFETIARLRDDPELCDIPVIVLTGRVLSNQESEFLEKNTRRVLYKQSIERSMLTSGLKDILRSVGGPA